MVEYLLARKIRDVRLKQRLTIAEVAKRANLSKSLISKIENNKISSPIATLLKIAEALNVRIGYFFEQQASGSPAIVSRRGQRNSFVRKMNGVTHTYELLALEQSIGTVQPFLITASRDPMSSGLDEFDQHDNDEFMYILEGQIEIVIGADQKYVLGAGDSLLFDANTPHLLRLADCAQARWVGMLTSRKSP